MYTDDTVLVTAFKNWEAELFKGKYNTQQFASTNAGYNDCTSGKYTEGLYYNMYCVATTPNASLSFYPPNVDKSNSIVGQGNWYVPAIGELALLNGFDVSLMIVDKRSSGSTGTTSAIVDTTLTKLAQKGVDAEKLSSYSYWSSTKQNKYRNWNMDVTLSYTTLLGERSHYYQYGTDNVRFSLEF